MNRLLFFLIPTLLSISSIVVGQEKYYVAFSDKQGTPYSVDNPSEFLTNKSIDRRAKQGISVTEMDLPVSPNYIDEIKQTGAKVLYPLKWFNGAVVEVYSEEMVSTILNMTFVTEVIMIYDTSAKGVALPEDEIFPAFSGKRDNEDYFNYGASTTQVKMLNGHKLHNLGYRGNTITIAVLDAGFNNANNLSSFDSIFQNGQVILTRDFVNPSSDIYQEHSHGTLVLSTMAGNLPGQLIGTAPEADYILLRSEDANTEQIIEEYNWCAAAELADSLGADIISSSLGYYEFDASWQNHQYSEMNGVTTPAARAASIAAQKGMIVVASAGNEGNKEWQHIITPSDAFGCIAVGAVDGEGSYVAFSSIGPSADGRVKPDVVAMGQNAAVQTISGEIGTASGTSLSAPIISGMIACLWQALPSSTSADIYQFLIRSCSLYQAPNTTIGYGIPNFELALNSINSQPNGNRKLTVFPNPSSGEITIFIPWEGLNDLNISLIDLSGKEVLDKKITASNSFYTFTFPDNLSTGIYVIRLAKGSETIIGKVVKYCL